MTIRFYISGSDVLDNFSSHMITIDGVRYPTVEHAYQTIKCTNVEGRSAIRNAISPIAAKHFANEVYKEYKNSEWDEIKLGVMRMLLEEKLAQHEDVRQALAATGLERLAEASPVDNFWGEGADGGGKNHLGKIWMELRETL
jgi:ribA/ribD-fused uncharacterized protein